MAPVLWVGFGSALGGMARYWFSGFVAQRFGATFPWGTLLVNISGSFLIGILASLFGTEGRGWVSANYRDFMMLGICGGYTTFSSFSLQTLSLLQDGDWLKAGLNAVGSVVGCMVAVWLGYGAGLVVNK